MHEPRDDGIFEERGGSLIGSAAKGALEMLLREVVEEGLCVVHPFSAELARSH